jgi:hypothetical protein
MKNNTRITIAGLLAAAASVLNALATELGDLAPASAEAAAAPQPEPEKPKRRERLTKAETAPAPEPEKPEVKEEAPEKPEVAEEAPKEATTTTGKTYDELKAIIKPFVEDGQGAEVKKIIAKYAPSLKEIDPKDHAAFEKDIAALGY